jgi:CheY-like chemotaxis protein
MNLVSNACEALSEEGGTVDVSTEMMQCDEALLSSVLMGEGCQPGSYACLEVSDTGIGMDEATVERMFDPFFTTKFTGRGLGLAAVSGIVRGHNGAILVESSRGKGTNIRILLPVTAEETGIRTPAQAKRQSQAGAGRIVLVVDDDSSVLEVSARMLESGGFRVITASDGHDALHAFCEHLSEIECVLLDLTMPGMGGEDAYEELRRLGCKAPVILGSGYFHADLSSQFTEKGFSAVLQKPYRRDRLIATVAAAMENES